MSKNSKKRIRVLDADERLILKDSDKFSDDRKEKFALFLSNVKKQYWIECNCNVGDAFLVIYSARHKILVRCKERKRHKQDCIFFIKSIEFSLKGSGKTLLPMRKIRKYDFYFRNQMFSSKEASDQKENNHVTTSRLGQALYTFYTDSECNKFSFAKGEKIYDQLLRFSEAVGDASNKISDNLTIGNVYRYKINEQSVEQAKKMLRNIKFPSYLKSFVLFSSRVTSINNNKITVVNYNKEKERAVKNWQVKSVIKKPSEWISFDKSAPFFVLATYIFDETEEEYLFKDVFAMPVYKSGNIMPVESDYERKVLDLIIGLIARNRNKEEYTVEKPLFGMQTTNKERYRPDFIITRETTGFTIYIEVLGSQNIDYLNHKEIIAKRATGYCDKYLSIRGYNFYNEKAEFIKKLKLYLIY